MFKLMFTALGFATGVWVAFTYSAGWAEQYMKFQQCPKIEREGQVAAREAQTQAQQNADKVPKPQKPENDFFGVLEKAQNTQRTILQKKEEIEGTTNVAKIQATTATAKAVCENTPRPIESAIGMIATVIIASIIACALGTYIDGLLFSNSRR